MSVRTSKNSTNWKPYQESGVRETSRTKMVRVLDSQDLMMEGIFEEVWQDDAWFRQ